MELRKIRNPKGERKRGEEKNSRKRRAKGSLCLRCIRSLTKRPGLRTQRRHAGIVVLELKTRLYSAYKKRTLHMEMQIGEN